jgi:hypothetical protein
MEQPTPIPTPQQREHDDESAEEIFEILESWASSRFLNGLPVSAGVAFNTLSDLIFSNAHGVTFGLNSNTLTASILPGGGGGGNVFINVSAGSTSDNVTAVTFSNGNGVTFGLDLNDVVTASVATNYLTTAMRSDANTLSNFKLSAGTLSANRSDLTFSNSNGVSFGLSANGALTATVATNYQSQGAYLTTAMQSNAATISNVKVSAGTLSSNRSDLTFSNGGGVSFGLDTNGVLTATVATNYLTTAALSGDTSNYAGIGFTTASTAGTALVGTHGTNGLSLGVPAWLTTAGAGGGAALKGSGAYSQNTGTISFVNSNGITFGLSTNQMTASVETNYQSPGAYLTTAALSGDTSKYAGINGAITGGSITVNTSGVSVNLPAYLTTAALSQDSSKYAGISTGITGGSVTLNTAGIAISLPAYLTTAMASNAATISNVNVSAGTTSNNLSALTFSNSNGVSFGLDGSTVTATVATNYQSQGAYLTTAARSQDSSNYAGTSAGITGGSLTLDTNGVAIILPAYLTTAMQSDAATISNIAISAGTLSNNLSAVTFSNGGAIAFGLNTNSVLTAKLQLTVSAAGGTSHNSAQGLSFADAHNVSFGVATSAGANAVITASVATSLTNIRVSAGSTSFFKSAFTFGDSGGVSWGFHTSNTGVITATVQTNYQSSGNYLTTAMASDAATISNVNVSAGTTSNNLSALTFGDSNGISFGLDGSTVTATVATNYQSQGAYLTTAMLSNAVTISNIRFSAGTLSNNLSALTFSDSNGVSFGLNTNSVVTATVATNYQSQGAYLTTAALSQDSSKYAGTSTGITGGSVTLNTSGIAINLPAYLTTAALSADSSKYAGTSTGITGGSVTLNTSGIAINLPAYLTTAALSADSSKYAGTSTGITGGSVTLNTSGIAISLPAYLTTAALSADSSKYAGTSAGITGGSVTLNTSGIAINLPAYLTTADLSANSSNYVAAWDILGANTAGTTSSAQGTKLHFSAGNSLTLSGNSNTIIFSVGAYLTTAALSGDTSKYAGVNGAITGGSITVNTSGVSINLPAYLTTAALSAQTSNFAGTNTSVLTIAGSDIAVTLNTTGLTVGYPKWLTTAQAPGAYLTTAALSADSSKYAGTSTGITGGSVTLNTSGIAINLPAYLTTAALSGDTSKYAGVSTGTQTTAGVNLLITNNTSGINFGVPAWLTTADLSQNSSKYAGTVSGATNCNVTVNTAGVSVSLPFISSYENFAPGNFTSGAAIAASGSVAVAFLIPQPISASILRLFASMATNSTTLSTAAASMNGSAQVFSTLNAVVYSLGTGANSQSLQYVASGSTGWTMLNSISLAADGTSGSYTQGITGYGDGANASQSTQGTIANTNYSFTTGWFSNFTGPRCLDIPFANSLSAGAYWLLFGYSTSSNSNSARCSNATNCIASISYVYGLSCQAAAAIGSIGIMGATNLTSVHGGAGSFTTVGGGTTNSLPTSAISTITNAHRIYFQLLRSA